MENKSKIELTIRPEPELGERWTEFLWAEEARQKKRRLGNGLLIRALTEFLDRQQGVAGTVPVLEPKPSPNPDEITYYKARMAEAAKKAAEAAEILAAAIGGQIDRSADPVTEPDQKTTEEIMRDIKAEFDHTAGRIREHEARIQEAEKQPGTSKRAAHRKAPGGAA